jgi:hypothetical protein
MPKGAGDVIDFQLEAWDHAQGFWLFKGWPVI